LPPLPFGNKIQKNLENDKFGKSNNNIFLWKRARWEKKRNRQKREREREKKNEGEIEKDKKKDIHKRETEKNLKKN
jgi:hypothetical protein